LRAHSFTFCALLRCMPLRLMPRVQNLGDLLTHDFPPLDSTEVNTAEHCCVLLRRLAPLWHRHAASDTATGIISAASYLICRVHIAVGVEQGVRYLWSLRHMQRRLSRLVCNVDVGIFLKQQLDHLEMSVERREVQGGTLALHA
jgi:hypothetical protein